jgi:ribosomal protein S18 acetylase RimI-like enzyme
MQLYRKAIITDTEAIAQLVNSAYRGESSRAGWTTEADLLDGSRINSDEIKQLIETKYAIILLCFNDAELVGSVCLEKEQKLEQAVVHIGMFVVKPVLQGRGIGKRLLAEAEKLANQTWEVQKFQMHVITVRQELIAFYGRLGYQQKGIFSDFPANPDVWQPKVTGLRLEVLEKNIGTQDCSNLEIF